MSTGGDLTKTQHYQEATAQHNKKGKRTVAKKTPRSEVKPVNAEEVDPNKIVYDPIPKYHGTSASDLRDAGLDITVLPEWRNDFQYNRRDFAPSQLNFKQAWEELEKELELPSRQQQKKQIDQHEDPAAKDMWRKHFAKKEQTIYKEACMHNVGGVASVAWIPADINDLSKTD